MDLRIRISHINVEAVPGSRVEYSEPYRGCFVRDLDGYQIEAAFWDKQLEHDLNR